MIGKYQTKNTLEATMSSIRLSADIIDKCRDFANKRTDKSLALYKQRGELNRQKIFADIFHGTLAEFAVSHFLSGCSQPDLNIYDVPQKSYSKDLKFKDINIHVKSQALKASARYGLSWVFQKYDPLVLKPTKQDYLALTCVLPDLTVQINGIMPARSSIFKPLKIESYASSKTALYLTDALEFIVPIEEFASKVEPS